MQVCVPSLSHEATPHSTTLCCEIMSSCLLLQERDCTIGLARRQTASFDFDNFGTSNTEHHCYLPCSIPEPQVCQVKCTPQQWCRPFLELQSCLPTECIEKYPGATAVRAAESSRASSPADRRTTGARRYTQGTSGRAQHCKRPHQEGTLDASPSSASLLLPLCTSTCRKLHNVWQVVTYGHVPSLLHNSKDRCTQHADLCAGVCCGGGQAGAA